MKTEELSTMIKMMHEILSGFAEHWPREHHEDVLLAVKTLAETDTKVFVWCIAYDKTAVYPVGASKMDPSERETARTLVLENPQNKFFLVNEPAMEFFPINYDKAKEFCH